MRRILLYFSFLLLPVSCGFISSALYDGEVVAKVGQNKLFLSELEKYIPAGLAPEDSAGLASQYINTWAAEQLYLMVAQEQLSLEEMDVTQELEDYRRSLIKYRYEKRYINDRLDTLVTDDQIAEYYNAHKADYILRGPIMKVRFADLMKDSRHREEIISGLRTGSPANSSALRWVDYSGSWIDADDLAKEFGLGRTEMLSLLRNDYIRYEPVGRGDLLVAFVIDIIYSGPAPVEYCREQIRDKILSSRKHNLAKSLEQDLLETALEKKTLIIYK